MRHPPNVTLTTDQTGFVAPKIMAQNLPNCSLTTPKIISDIKEAIRIVEGDSFDCDAILSVDLVNVASEKLLLSAVKKGSLEKTR